MKKIIIILLILVVVVATGGLVFYFLPSHQQWTAEDLLPASPVFYVRASHLSQRIEDFRRTKLWNDLKAIDYKKMAEKSGSSSQVFSEIQKNIVAFSSPENQVIFKALFGKEVALAVYSDESLNKSPAGIPQVFMQMASNIFIITRVGADVKAAEVLTKWGGKFSKDFTTSTSKYKGKTMNLITSKDGMLTLGYVLFNDLLVIGVGEKAGRSAIDVAARSQKSLSRDEAFLKRKKSFMDHADTIGFIQLQPIYQLLKEQIATAPSPSKVSSAYQKQLEEQFKQTQGLEAIVFANKTSDVLIGKADLYYDAAKLHPDLKSFYRCGPDENKTAKFVPGDAIFYNWNTCLDFPLMWQQYKRSLEAQAQQAGKEAAIDQMISSYEQLLGFTIEGDVLPVLGKEFGVYLTDVDTSGHLPIPKLVIFVQTTGRDKAAIILNKLFSLQPLLRSEETTHHNEIIKFVSIPMADSFKVGYTFVGDYLLLATNVDVLKASLDAAKNSDKAIGINTFYRTTIGGESSNAKRNSVFFLQFNLLMQEAISILDWAKQMTKQGLEQQKAFLTGSQKNLDDVKASKAVLKQELADLQKQLREAEQKPESDLALLAIEHAIVIENLQKQIQDHQKNLAASEDKEQSLEQLIKEYQAKTPPIADHQEVIEQIANPLLKALSHIKFISSSTVNGEGILQSTSYLKVE